MSKFRQTASYLTTFDDETIQGPLVRDERDFMTPEAVEPELVKSPRGPHDADYVDRFVQEKLLKEEENQIGFRNGLYKLVINRTLLEVGATIMTCEAALAHGLATSVAGGTHHAFEGRGSGFTILNDVAVAAQKLLKEGEDGERAIYIPLMCHN